MSTIVADFCSVRRAGGGNVGSTPMTTSDGRRRRNAKHTAARQRFAIAARSLLARWRVTQYETRVKSVVWFMSGGGARGRHRCAIAPA